MGTNQSAAPTPNHIIETARLRLAPFTERAIEALLAGDFAGASAVAGFDISPGFDYGVEHFELRLKQLRADPAWAPWLTRAVVVKATNVAAGHAGLHGAPGVNSLDDPAGVEIGYTIMEPHRRKGFAEEAARGLFAWAATQPGVKRGYASVAPSNGPSLRLSAKLGMNYLTEVWDDDGPEHVFWSDLPLPVVTARP